MEKYILIMAGGVGSRFWPRSRKNLPKQLLNIFGQQTMIQETVSRIKNFVPPENILIITNKVQKALVEEQLPFLPKENIVAEPIGRNTAPCVGLAAKIINKKSRDAVFVTLPADHLIKNNKLFIETLNRAMDFAYQSKGLITFGITPTRPDTGYGYINFEKTRVENKIHRVIKFVEKPNIQKAKSYLKSGDYSWNSGMFVWRADVILDEISRHLPELSKALDNFDKSIKTKDLNNSLETLFNSIKGISVDYGIMEKSDKVFMIKGEFDWSDVGSWETVYELSKKDESNNALVGDVHTDRTKDSYIYSPEKFTSVIGLQNIVVIDTKDALLVCNRENVQEVRDTVQYLTKKNRDDLV
ncbi:MAG: sugar phosphate nucleotidyltransferase [Ignavibacteriaceae bacterium]|nr:sugar phosphate nucleotidyltransferase [Ignavibacteriaceae bacterium]